MSGLGPDGNEPDMTRGPALLAVSVTTAVVALSTCALRFCVKFRINRSVVWDDYFLGLAMVKLPVLPNLLLGGQFRRMADSYMWHCSSSGWLG
jgi:hypothetical protein